MALHKRRGFWCRCQNCSPATSPNPNEPGCFSGHVVLYRPTHHCPPVFSFYTDVLLARTAQIPTERRTEIHNLYTAGRTVLALYTTKLIAFCRRVISLALHLLHSDILQSKNFLKRSLSCVKTLKY